MGNKVYVEDFNPSSKCWNRTAIIDMQDFDDNINYTSKYGGIVRIRYVDENGKEFAPKELEKEVLVVEEEKVLTEEIPDDKLEVEEVVKEKETYFGSKKKFFE